MNDGKYFSVSCWLVLFIFHLEWQYSEGHQNPIYSKKVDTSSRGAANSAREKTAGIVVKGGEMWFLCQDSV